MQIKNSPTQEAFIHRHCMQRVIHEAIASPQKTCHGLLTGSGNIITNNINVTKKLFSSNDFSPKPHHNEAITGYYFATKKRDASAQESITKLQSMVQDIGQQKSFYYLIVYMDHDGRVDAQMYADPALSIPVTLNMKED